MLEIRTHQFTRDGRAVVATIGGRRFKVLNSSTKDGYTVAQVEWVKDIRVENEQEKAGMYLFDLIMINLGRFLNWFCFDLFRASSFT